MKWILFTGTWRLTNDEVENDVRLAVRDVLSKGWGIVTGGATGVDYFAMDEVMKDYPDGSRLKVIIPTSLKDYEKDYIDNWQMDPIGMKEINDLIKLLEKVKEMGSLIEMEFTNITQDHYDLRHDEEVKISDALYAFQVNDSTGTQDTIDKAVKAGLPVHIHKKYKI